MAAVLGLGGYTHDSAAALVVDGQLVAAVQEERLTRVKHVGGFPHASIEFCLETAGLSIQDVDAVTFYTKRSHWLGMAKTTLQSAKNHPLEALKNGKRIAKRLSWQGYKALSFEIELRRFLQVSKIGSDRFFDYDHHLCHAASTYYSSPHDKMAILCIDAVGDSKTTSFWLGDETGVREIAPPVRHPHSIAHIYSQLTKFLGFKSLGDQYKVMGLAAYGQPVYLDRLSELVLREEGSYKMNPDYFDWREDFRLGARFFEDFGQARAPGGKVEQNHMDFAASLQRLFEDVVMDLALHLKKVSGLDKIGLAGGAALNCSANGKIKLSDSFSDVFVLPCASDLGTCLGSAQYHAHNKMGQPNNFVLKTDAWGPSFSDDETESVLKRSGVRYRKTETPGEDGAKLIAEGNIVGWFQGKMEFGPRALGQRSILADPRDSRVKDRVNFTIKFREEFRPFAPMVLREDAEAYFGLDADMPFMTFAVTSTEDKRDQIPSVVHVDGTSRVQTVTADTTPELHHLLSTFRDMTGVPVILNTSFNLAGDPIVCTPEDALRTFFTCGMDHLIIGSFVVSK